MATETVQEDQTLSGVDSSSFGRDSNGKFKDH